DSFLLVHALTNWYAREPRIVLKETLRWDPAIDVLLARRPSRFISAPHHHPPVIFPRGGNFPQHRRARAIERLRRDGFMDGAARAEAMRYVLAPKPGGVLAALDAAGEADVVWVAHTGTDHLFTVAHRWRGLPIAKALRVGWWQG